MNKFVFAICAGMWMGGASIAGVADIPPQILPPKYAMVDQAYFESKFGSSFTGENVTPLVVGARDPQGWHPLQRIDLSTGAVVLYNAGSIQPTNFQPLPRLNATVRNMVDFVSTDPNLIGVDWSMTSQGQTVLANVQTTGSESLRMLGVWLTLRVVNADVGQNDTVTVFIAEAVQTGNGNESLSGPSEDIDQYLTIIDCESLTGQECADLQQCYTNYANCMINAATVYNDAVEDCNSWETTIIGVGAGGCTGTGLGLGIGTVVPGLGTCIGGALGMVIGGIAGGITAYWLCMDDASDTYYTASAICVNNLEACVGQWLLAYPQ